MKTLYLHSSFNYFSMSMIGNYLRVSEAELQEYLNDSSKLEQRIFDEADENDPHLIDVDKAWDGIFYLVTGKTMETVAEAEAPLAWISYPPNEIDPDQDMGYGPATYTTPAQTKELNAALEKISEEQFKASYDGKKMTGLNIYPQGWGDDDVEYLLGYFNDLKSFYKKASDSNQAVIVFIN